MEFKMPAKSDLKGRTSTISNAFAISITPYLRPTEEELTAYYQSLNIEEGQCAYCLGVGNGKDHLKPLVSNGMPTGYITDIHNLVPCCQRCNSSKGSKPFQEWYRSSENISRLKHLGLSDEIIERRYKIITEFEKQVPKPVDYEAIVGKELWEEYKERKNKMLLELKENQEFCNRLNEIIVKEIKR